MSLAKAIASGKEHRKEYRKLAPRIDKSCRNHGGCQWCTGNRLYTTKRELERTSQMLQEVANW